MAEQRSQRYERDTPVGQIPVEARNIDPTVAIPVIVGVGVGVMTP